MVFVLMKKGWSLNHFPQKQSYHFCVELLPVSHTLRHHIHYWNLWPCIVVLLALVMPQYAQIYARAKVSQFYVHIVVYQYIGEGDILVGYI